MICYKVGYKIWYKCGVIYYIRGKCQDMEDYVGFGVETQENGV